MAFVRTRVNRNALCSKFFAHLGNIEHIRIIATAGVAQGGNFVNIYT